MTALSLWPIFRVTKLIGKAVDMTTPTQNRIALWKKSVEDYMGQTASPANTTERQYRKSTVTTMDEMRERLIKRFPNCITSVSETKWSKNHVSYTTCGISIEHYPHKFIAPTFDKAFAKVRKFEKSRSIEEWI